MAPNLKVKRWTTLHLNESQFITLIICLGDITLTVAHLDENCECCAMTSEIGQGSLGGLYWWWGTICCKFGTGVSSEASPQGGQTGWGHSSNIRWFVYTTLASWQKKTKTKNNPTRFAVKDAKKEWFSFWYLSSVIITRIIIIIIIICCNQLPEQVGHKAWH